jgi:putative spermidine/putrescine transport system substrate-binding protein
MVVKSRLGVSAALAAALTVLAGPVVTSAHAADLVVTAFGGTWEQKYRECIVDVFQKRTGKTAEVVIGNPVQWTNQIAANPANPPIHVLINTFDGAYDAISRGIVDKLDETNVPNLANVEKSFRAAGRDHGAVFSYGALGLAYNEKIVKTPPKSWQEFVDGTIEGKWTAAIPGISYATTPMTVIWLLAHVYGGDIDNVDPAFAKIKAMKDSGHLIFWNDVNEFLNLMKTGEVDMGMYWDGRTYAFQDAGNPTIKYVNPAPGSVVSPTMIQKVKNAPDLAYKFIDIALEAGPQSCWGNAIQYGMSNAKTEYSPEVAPRISKVSEIVWAPFDRAAEKRAAWVERWNKEIGQ